MTNPDGQVAAAGDPAILVPPPAAEPGPASGLPQVQASRTGDPLIQARSSPPDLDAAKNSSSPEPSTATDGTPVRFAGLPASVLHPLHARPFQRSDAAVPAVVTQKTSVPFPAPTTGTGELAQLPPMLFQAVQRVFWFGRRCLVTPTEPSASVSKTSTSPRGSRTAAGSALRSGGCGDAASCVPHSQSFGNPGCCQACSTRPDRSRATADGLDTIVVGDSPTAWTADHVRLPTGRCQACESAWSAERANHSAVPLLLIATAMR